MGLRPAKAHEKLDARGGACFSLPAGRKAGPASMPGFSPPSFWPCLRIPLKQPRRRGGALLVRRDQLVPLGAGIGIRLLARGVGVEPGQGAADAFRERHGGTVTRNVAFDLT